MNEQEPSFHYVSTREEARAIIDAHDRFWVSACGCREEGPGCRRSRMDLCLFFDTAEMQGTGSDFKEVDREFVEGILNEAENKHLVTRPFRYEADRTRDQGICFCCDDCVDVCPEDCIEMVPRTLKEERCQTSALSSSTCPTWMRLSASTVTNLALK